MTAAIDPAALLADPEGAVTEMIATLPADPAACTTEQRAALTDAWAALVDAARSTDPLARAAQALRAYESGAGLQWPADHDDETEER